MKWKIKNIKVSDIKENPKNPRKLTEKGLKDLETSISKFGNAEPPVLNKDLSLIGGHGRKKILERLNISEVECYVSEKQLTEKQADELGIRLNKNIAGVFDFDILANSFEVEELLEWGFEEFELGIDESKSEKKLPSMYQVIIECENEKEQEETFGELNEKYKCSLLTL